MRKQLCVPVYLSLIIYCRDSEITHLTTPSFINQQNHQNLNALLKTYQQQSSLIRKIQMDTQLANANVKAQSAAKNPMCLPLENIV